MLFRSAALTTAVPARPLNMVAIEATNRGVAEAEWAMPGLATAKEVDLSAVAERPSEAILIDVREPEEYGHGHVPGAISIPQAELATRLAEIPRDRPVVLHCAGGYRSSVASSLLRREGWADVSDLLGGFGAWAATVPAPVS